MPTPTWVGDTSIYEAPGSPRHRRTATSDQIIRTLRGPYDSLIVAAPDPGETMAGYTGYSVDSVETYPDGAGIDGPGTQVIVLNADEPPTVSTGGSETIEEVDAGVLEKKLESHPLFTTGGGALEPEDHDAIAAWRSAQSAAERAAAYSALSTNAKVFADKVMLGIESYVVAAPVARKTTRSYVKPTVGGIGTRSTGSPITAAPSGYVWLKTGDRVMRQGPNGKWERVEEWTGADSWDSSLYT